MTESAHFIKGERWYCVRSKPKKERLAASSVEALHKLPVFCPQSRFRRKTKRGPVWFQEAMFPGYLFVRFDMYKMKRAISYSPEVLAIPEFGGHYMPVPDAVIEALMADLDESSVADAGLPLEVGDETTVLEGSLQGIKVKVIRLMPAQDRVAVLLEMLGTLVEAEFSTQALEHRLKKTMAAEK